jgi:hypothetical protein
VIEATCAVQGAETRSLFNGDITLVVAEAMTPCSGVRVSAQLKEAIPSLKVVLTSALPMNCWPDHVATQFRELPLDSIVVLEKPFTPSELLRIVDRLLGEIENR